MTFADARRILTGNDGRNRILQKFKHRGPNGRILPPIVDRAMQRVGVVQQYRDRLLATAPGASALRGQFDLNQYVVGKPTDCFLMLGDEEKKIRKDPAAQTTALLREVFGGSKDGGAMVDPSIIFVKLETSRLSPALGPFMGIRKSIRA